MNEMDEYLWGYALTPGRLHAIERGDADSWEVKRRALCRGAWINVRAAYDRVPTYDVGLCCKHCLRAVAGPTP